MASHWRRSGGSLSSIGEKQVERGKLWLVSPFIGEGEREEETVVPHVGVRMLVACRTSWTMARVRFPYPRSLNGGPRSGLQTWCEPKSVWAACTVHQFVLQTLSFLFFQTELNL
jgi:hypothetical protein